jgi:flap endonuclease-1
MGVSITELIPSKEISLDDISGKLIAVDTHLFLYQFLTTIRQRDGTPLMDHKGRVTSHLSGIFQRTIKLLEKGIRPIFVFDGKTPELKKVEQERRSEAKVQAKAKYDRAVQEEDVESMKKYAGRTSRLTREMIEETKELLSALGVPIVQAPAEGEAQASYMVKKGDAWAIASSDADSLMFGATRVIKNLAVTGRRKKTNALAYTTVKPELIELGNVLNSLGIDGDQLICLCMLVGTDYNPGGIKGIGPQKALKLIKQYKSDFSTIFKDAGWDDHFSFPWTDVFYQIKKMPVSDDYSIEFSPIDHKSIIRILVDEHGFSRERIEDRLGKLIKEAEKKTQKGLGEFF